MNPFKSAGMRYDGTTFSLLDQTLLPHQEQWIPCMDVSTLEDAISRLAIRGAPAIGISAALLLALLAEKGTTKEELKKALFLLENTRPTAVNLRNNLARIREAIDSDEYPVSVTRTAESLYHEDIELCRKIAHNGVQLVNAGDKLLTHCNTGGLATSGEGTAMAILAEASRRYEDIFVWVDETRPLLQGGRLTAWECSRKGIRHAVICDSAAAMLMREGKVDKIFVGCDCIAVNGDFANKIGTYSLAVLARYHAVPFYVAGPNTTVSSSCKNGNAIPIEMRNEDEIRGVKTPREQWYWVGKSSPTFNPAFDITPAELVTGWILDTGVYYPQDIQGDEWWKNDAEKIDAGSSR